MNPLSIVIPCYNEASNLIRIIEKIDQIHQQNPEVEIVIVDNGSTDSTPEVLKELIEPRMHFITRHRIEKNQGYGHGIVSGIRIAKGEVLSWTHADLQTDPLDVIHAYQEFIENPMCPDCILKGRRVGRNFFDTMFTAGMSVLSTLLLRVPLSDVNAQPKMFHRNFLGQLTDAPMDFSLDLYLLYQARTNNYLILEHPVHFGKRLHGEAKGGGSLKGKWKLILRTWKYMLRLKRELNR